MIRKILFVDDDRVLQIVVNQQLAGFAEHFSIVFANDGLDAIKKMESGCYSLVCIDLNMPRMNGASLFSHIRSNFPNIPVIIMSSHSKEDMKKQVPPLGVLEYFTKPLQIDVLGKRILKYLQKEAQGGIMYNVSPPVFFQFMEMEAKTCTAIVLDNGSRQGGILYFTDGQLVEARTGVITGLEAAHTIFSWNDVTVFLENKCPDIENSINLPLQTIIMQAVSMKDEDEEEIQLQDLERDLAAGVGEDTVLKLKSLQFDEITNFLSEEVSENRVDEIVENSEQTLLVKTLSKAGKQTQAGEVLAGLVRHAVDDVTVLLPQTPPVAITCTSESSAKNVITLLREKS